MMDVNLETLSLLSEILDLANKASYGIVPVTEMLAGKAYSCLAYDPSTYQRFGNGAYYTLVESTEDDENTGRKKPMFLYDADIGLSHYKAVAVIEGRRQYILLQVKTSAGESGMYLIENRRWKEICWSGDDL